MSKHIKCQTTDFIYNETVNIFFNFKCQTFTMEVLTMAKQILNNIYKAINKIDEIIVIWGYNHNLWEVENNENK